MEEEGRKTKEEDFGKKKIFCQNEGNRGSEPDVDGRLFCAEQSQSVNEQ